LAIAGVADTRMSAAESVADDDSVTGTELKPGDVFQGIFDALKRFPLVALGERHMLQEYHDFLTSLLFHPGLAGKVNDIVVEFGNALHQDLADRYVLNNEPIANGDLAQMWRFTIGGGVLWDAPVYAQFFRNVRAANWMRPAEHRIRVILGDPPFDHRKFQSVADGPYAMSLGSQRDRYYAALVEREVLAKGRRALLVAGTGHVSRGMRVHGQPNFATLLTTNHPDQLFVIVPLIERRTKASPQMQAVARWPRPSLAPLKGTWLGATRHPSDRLISPAAARLDYQADAVLYLGAAEELTASRPEPTLYQTGQYAAELKRLMELARKLGVDANLDGVKLATAGPLFFQ
jgi:hypothetical protein